MSWTLGIDTSSTELSIGLYKDNKPFVSMTRYSRNSHAEHITKTIIYILESNNITAKDITRLGVATGPGSFTGLRIGIAFMKGFCLTRSIKILPISSLESIACSFNCNNATLMTAMDARQNRVFCARFKKENGIVTRLLKDALLSKDDFSALCKKNDIIIFDTLGYQKSTVFDEISKNGHCFSTSEISLQRGLACAGITSLIPNESSSWINSVDVLPNYMQPSYAEMQRKNG